jgi:hypothetical protein
VTVPNCMMAFAIIAETGLIVVYRKNWWQVCCTLRRGEREGAVAPETRRLFMASTSAMRTEALLGFQDAQQSKPKTQGKRQRADWAPASGIGSSKPPRSTQTGNQTSGASRTALR